MSKRLIMVCGGVGAGKTTYSMDLAAEIGAVRFSIDPWMQTLYAADMQGLDYAWMLERVHRCYRQIWDVAAQILSLEGNVVLDLGFTAKSQRALFVERAAEISVRAELHYIDVPRDIRRQRVTKRNAEKDPDLYAIEVTDFMFDFMEPRFEVPDERELANGVRLSGA